MDVLQLIQTVATVVGSGAVLVATQAFRHSKTQEVTSFEDVLAREYREIVGDLPAAAFFKTGIAKLSEPQEQAMFRYFDLSNEQLRLIEEDRVSPETAEVWQDGIADVMELPTFAARWTELRRGLPEDFFTSLNATTSSPGLAPGGAARRKLSSP